MPRGTPGNSEGYQAVPSWEIESAGFDLPDKHRTVFGVAEDAPGLKQWTTKSTLSLAGGLFAALSLLALYATSSNSAATLMTDTPEGEFDSMNRYILRNFDMAKPMSSFLNGLGGVWGVPMWAFYVNRGQGISSFGKQNKDSAIAKFVTAEKAYQQTPFTGFRTMLKGRRQGEAFEHMPFFPLSGASKSEAQPERNMMIGLNEMEIEEKHADLNLQTNVLYLIAPNQDFPALIRKTTFTNTDPRQTLDLEVLDGLAKIVPNGLGNYLIDAMGRTMEAWMNVYNVGAAQDAGAPITQPFFHISQDTADSAQVRVIKDGYFSVAYLDSPQREAADLLPFVVDPTAVFGQDTSLTRPVEFLADGASAQSLALGPQGTTSRTPCAFAAATLRLAPGESVTITSVYGYADSLETFVGKYTPTMTDPAYSASKRAEAEAVAEDIVRKVKTQTASQLFDSYVQQDFLDNVLRGGLPMMIGEGANRKPFHVYSRIHGDLERDYNYFQIDTTYFSQGPGNFRDVAQNRRVDTFHTPDTGDFNLRMFLAFVQADGYNPLTVASTLFRAPAEAEALEALLDSLQILEPSAGQGSRNFVRTVISRAFRPGQLFRDMAIGGVQFALPREQVANKILGGCVQEFAGQFNQNGFWSDHWTYTLDLLDAYVAIFPDQEEAFVFAEASVPFFMSPAVVRARSSRLSLVADPARPGSSAVRAYGAISTPADADYPRERLDALNAIYADPALLSDGASGNFYQRARDLSVFKVSPLTKLLMLGVIKFSTLDPFGFGVEMEGGKPGWNDAMNGLPGLLGSGMPETYEMLRVLRYVQSALVRFPRALLVPVEFRDLLVALDAAVVTYLAGDRTQQAAFAFWDAANGAREAYRHATVATFQGATVALGADFLVAFLARAEQRVELGVAAALRTTPSGLSPTYFIYDVTDFAQAPAAGSSAPQVAPKAFAQRSLPLFLEGPTRHLKTVRSQEERLRIYESVRASPLFDAALQMYTICDSLAGMGQEVGRMKAFSAGWLENQSVWLHMSYKFYLELLRAGLYAQFFREARTGLVPFMDHRVYGRSPLEAASFVVSSAFPDRKLHGASFAARLSGSTAEFLSMWAVLFAGHAPFALEGGALRLRLQPVLPEWLFGADGRAAFTFLGEVAVTYRNPARADSWTLAPRRYTLRRADGTSEEVEGAEVVGELARQVRARQFVAVEVDLA